MIELGVSRLPAETRAEGGGYTSLVIDGLQARYGRSGAVSSASGAVQSASGLWARCLAACCPADHPIVDAELLGSIGYDLGVEGETLWTPVVGPRGLMLARASTWTVYGTCSTPDGWEYDAIFNGPTGQTSRRLLADQAIHIRYLPDARRPWAGVPPWRRAPRLAELAAEVELALVAEARSPVKRIFPIPSGGADNDATAEKIKSKLRDRNEAVLLPETTAVGWGAGRPDAPQRDWRSEHMTPDPMPGIVALCGDIPHQVGALYGIPFGLNSENASQQREDWRRFVASSISPIAKLVQRVLEAALEEPVSLDVGALRSWDTTGAGRTVHVLTAAGVPLADALSIARVEP